MNNTELPEIPISEDCNYIAAFLTMACTYNCSYCINAFGGQRNHYKLLSGQQWVEALSRLTNLDHSDGLVPITLQGGEPSLHPDFYQIINELPERIKVDILTNLDFDIEEMIAKVDPKRLERPAPYAPIRVSYHPTECDLEKLFEKTLRLMEAGFRIGLYGVLHPDQQDIILNAQAKALQLGIDFRTKEFLGFHDGKLHGLFKYPEGCSLKKPITGPGSGTVWCKTTEILISPDGGIFRCHHDLYERKPAIGNILDRKYQISDMHLPCDYFGMCNPCDIKVKTNRLQQFGHTSVDIRFEEPAETISRINSKSGTNC